MNFVFMGQDNARKYMELFIMRSIVGIVVMVLFWGSLSFAADIEGVRFVKIAGNDQKAVIKNTDNKMRMVGLGDEINGATIVEIVDGRVVLEKPGAAGVETIIVRIDGDHQRIERISKKGEKPLVMKAPVEKPEKGKEGVSGY